MQEDMFDATARAALTARNANAMQLKPTLVPLVRILVFLGRP
jgi:hypothetical protein